LSKCNLVSGPGVYDNKSCLQVGLKG